MAVTEDTTRLKHSFTPPLKQSLIPQQYQDPQNVRVLDGKELARRIREAMDESKPPVTGSALAKACGVTPQAVHGWRTTGKVDKKHLRRLAALTKRPLTYFLDDENNLRQEDAQYTIGGASLIEDYEALPSGLREYLERKAAELRQYVESLPGFLRDAIERPPKDQEQYRAWEREIEADMAQRLTKSNR